MLEEHQRKHTPPPAGKFALLKSQLFPAISYEYSCAPGSHSAREREEPVGAYAKIQTLDTKDACLVDVKSLQFSSPSTDTGFVG